VHVTLDSPSTGLKAPADRSDGPVHKPGNERPRHQILCRVWNRLPGEERSCGEQVVVLADHTKIGRETMCQTVELDDIDILVTDAGADEEALEELGANGMEIVVASVVQPSVRREVG